MVRVQCSVGSVVVVRSVDGWCVWVVWCHVCITVLEIKKENNTRARGRACEHACDVANVSCVCLIDTVSKPGGEAGASSKV